MVQRRFDPVQLGQYSELADLSVMVTTPSSHVILNVMQIGVQTAEFGCDCVPVVLMLGGVDVSGDLENPIRFAVRFSKSWVVRVVVMKIEKQFTAQRFET